MKKVNQIYFKSYWAKRDRNGNPRAVLELWVNPENTVLLYFSYMQDYQAAEALLRKLISANNKFVSYQNDVNPDFFIMRKHNWDYEKHCKTVKKDKTYFVLNNLGEIEITVSQLKDLEKQSDNKKYYESSAIQFLKDLKCKVNNTLHWAINVKEEA